MIPIIYATDNESGLPHRLMVLPNGVVVFAENGVTMVEAEMSKLSYLGQPDDTLQPDVLAKMLGNAVKHATYLKGTCEEVAEFIRRSRLRVGSGLLKLDMKIDKVEGNELPWRLRIRDSSTGWYYCTLADFEDWHDAKMTGVFFLEALQDMGCSIDFNWDIPKLKN